MERRRPDPGPTWTTPKTGRWNEEDLTPALSFGYALADHVRHRNSPNERERRKAEAAKRRQRRATNTATKLKLAA